MANICSNELHISCSVETAEKIKKFMDENFHSSPYYDELDDDTMCLEFQFDSRWNFPEELMNKMLRLIPKPEDFDATCLSVEWGCLYCAFHTSNGEYWTEE